MISLNRFCAPFLLICAFLGIFSQSHAFYAELQGNVGGFIPLSGIGKGLYSTGTPFYSLTYACHFAHPWEYMPWKAWVEIGYIPGGRKHDHVKSIDLIPSGIGLKHSWCIGEIGEAYIGVGPTVTWIRLKEEVGFFRRRFTKQQLGVVGKTGLRWKVYPGWYAELFADYYYVSYDIGKPTKKHHRDQHFEMLRLSTLPNHLNLSGFNCGGGVGFNF